MLIKKMRWSTMFVGGALFLLHIARQVSSLRRLSFLSWQTSALYSKHQWRRKQLFFASFMTLNRKDGNDIIRRRQEGLLKESVQRMAVLQNLSTMNVINRKKTQKMMRLLSSIASLTEVQESSISGAGMGLFAAKDQPTIPPGTIVSFYPVHGLGVEVSSSHDDDAVDASLENESCWRGSITIGMEDTDQKYFDEARKNTSDDAYLQYLIGNRPLRTSETAAALFGADNPLFITANPNRSSNPPWNSHFINDGAIVLENSEQSIVEYYERSREAKNCVHIPFGPSPIVATVTTRNVLAGEELLTSYGCAYWVPYVYKRRNEEEQEMVQVTELILNGVQNTAKDLFQCFQDSQARHVKEAKEFQKSFLAL